MQEGTALAGTSSRLTCRRGGEGQCGEGVGRGGGGRGEGVTPGPSPGGVSLCHFVLTLRGGEGSGAGIPGRGKDRVLKGSNQAGGPEGRARGETLSRGSWGVEGVGKGWRRGIQVGLTVHTVT